MHHSVARDRHAAVLPRLRRRHRIGPPNAIGDVGASAPAVPMPQTAATLLDPALLQTLQAAGVAVESLVAVRTPAGEWLLLKPVDVRSAPAGAAAGFDDQAFASAVRAALDDLHLTHRLQGNPLLEHAAVKARCSDATSAVPALRDWLRSTNERLGTHPATARAARILHRSYFEPARSQQLAADALGLGYSTYRRLLAEARALLIAELRLA